MANPEHVAVVRKGREAIAEWWHGDRRRRLDLGDAVLRRARLGRAELRRAFLRRANLSGADLEAADLQGANLKHSMLFDARLQRVGLYRAKLVMANLALADLTGADLRGADLSNTNLTGAVLTGANLTGADLFAATLNSTLLEGANLSQARLWATSLSDVDVSGATGLSTVNHEAASSIGVDTLIRSFRGAGNNLTPELATFFRGAGVPEELLRDLPRLVAEVKYYSCFVCYGQPDVTFAKKLCQDLEARGVSCWLYDMDATVGEPTWGEIGRMRRQADKMVVLCSGQALVRPGMLKEIEEQIDEGLDKLVPISLDDFWKHPGLKVMRDGRDLKPFLLDRNYADFTNLPYQQALERLLAGLGRQDT